MNWQNPPEKLELAANDVHVWQVNLDAFPVSIELLSADEQSRANRFKFDHHRQRFIAGRGFLRSLLAKYLNADPASLKFDYGAHGKPFLKDSSMQFNLAHSEHLGLFAVSLDRAIGIDVEQIRVVEQLEALIARFFLPSEARTIQAQPELFFQYWTCKEAFLKATGTGLSKLKEVEIDRTELKKIPVEARSKQWQLQEIFIDDKFASAIAVERNCSMLNFSYFLEGV